jgi:inhibitor of KinA sporulation pathway (predicted exonuclease)
MSYKYLGILDFEANCLENKILYPQEIIEYPIIVYNIETQTIERERDFHYYCKIDTPLTKFCTGLTGITQQICDAGLPFKDVLKKATQWLYANNFVDDTGKSNILFVTMGDWDLETALVQQCLYSNIKVPPCFREWCNIKVIFQTHYKQKAGSMLNMLKFFNLKLEGKHHSGIDDCYNTARIADIMVRDGANFIITTRK